MRYAVLAIVTVIFAPSTVWAASHHPQQFLDDVRGKPDEGAQIVGHFCAVCHAQKPQIPLGAPRSQVSEEWESRLRKGMAVLLENTVQGLNAMPARGGCFECTDRQLTKAIIALLPEESRDQVTREIKAEDQFSVQRKNPESGS